MQIGITVHSPFVTAMQFLTRHFGKLSVSARKLPSQRLVFSTVTALRLRHLHAYSGMASPLKRKADKPATPSPIKKQKIVVPEYHTTPQRRDDTGEIVWPARITQIERAREIINEWYVHRGRSRSWADQGVSVLKRKSLL